MSPPLEPSQIGAAADSAQKRTRVSSVSRPFCRTLAADYLICAPTHWTPQPSYNVPGRRSTSGRLAKPRVQRQRVGGALRMATKPCICRASREVLGRGEGGSEAQLREQERGPWRFAGW